MNKYNFEIHPSSTNNGVIIYINDVLFPKLSIIPRINELYSVCFLGGLINLQKNNTLVLYVDMENSANKEKILELYYKNIEASFNVINKPTNFKYILGFLRIERFNKHIEIYDVCIDKNERNKGIMHSIFQDLNKFTPKQYEKFWLGVEFGNLSRDLAINLYTKNGFRFHAITLQTFSGKKIGFPVIGMINERNNLQIDRVETKKLIYQGLENIKCSFDVNFNWQDMIFIQKYTQNESVEFSGTFNIIPNKNNNFSLQLYDKNLLKGDDKNFEVDIIVDYMNWHTHPNICYLKNYCYIGWPSGQDMRFIFNNYPYGLLVHFLFTHEGLYTIKLTKEAMKFMYIIANNSIWIQSFAELIKLRFDYLEKYREIGSDVERIKCIDKTKSLNCLFYSNENRNLNINKFLERTNYKLNKYIINEKEYDFLNSINYSFMDINKNCIEAIKYFVEFSKTDANFPIFDVSFYSSHYINAHKNNIQSFHVDSITPPLKPFCS